MKTFEILVLECSPQRTGSTSSRLGGHVLGAIMAKLGALSCVTTVRNLGLEPPPALSDAYAKSVLIAPEEAKFRYGKELSVSDELVQELVRADLVLINSPLHNFGVPAALKLWIDLVVRSGVTFKLTPTGKVALLKDRPVLVSVSSGGPMFQDPPIQPDFFRPYLQAALGVIGLKNIHFIEAAGLAFSASPLETVDKLADAWVNEKLGTIELLGSETA